MMSDAAKLTKSNQEQAVAAWVNYLNQFRLDNLLSALSQQDENLQDALASVDEAIRKIDLEVVASNRGGVKGMHGFIAEIAEVGVGNARSQILGHDTVYQWVNDNGPVDLMRSGVEIQQKFVAAGGRFGLGAIAEHLQKYPDFVKNGGKYQIPGDHFEMIQKLYAMPPEEAGKFLRRSGGGPSLKDWERVQTFFEEGSIEHRVARTLEPGVPRGAEGCLWLDAGGGEGVPPLHRPVAAERGLPEEQTEAAGGCEDRACGRRHRGRDRLRTGRGREAP